MAVAKDICADAHDRHVDVFPAVEIPDPTALVPAEVSGPLFGQVQLGALGEQHVAAGDDALGPFPQFLAGSNGRALVPGQVAVGIIQGRLRTIQVEHIGP